MSYHYYLFVFLCVLKLISGVLDGKDAPRNWKGASSRSPNSLDGFTDPNSETNPDDLAAGIRMHNKGIGYKEKNVEKIEDHKS